ncbi:MAG: hypothetical protein LBL90_05570 [Prevotellaceae bacterium]|jgi:transposase|nr:hypothetical protein [Prevotellaceae bacterium]
MRVIKLTEAEKARLEHLCKISDNAVVRRRSFLLLLSNDNYSVKSICSIFKIHRNTLYHLYDAWETAQGEGKYSALRVAKGAGAKVKLAGIEEELKKMMEEHKRNLAIILYLLEMQHNIKVSMSTLQRFLKNKGL